MYPMNPFNPYPNVNPLYASHVNNGLNTASFNQVIKVNGRGGAEAYQMPPNSQVLLLDETQPIVWLKQTDGAGYPSLNAYDIKPHVDAKEPDFKSLEERVAKIEEVMKSESNYSNNGRKNANAVAGKANGTDDKVLR